MSSVPAPLIDDRATMLESSSQPYDNGELNELIALISEKLPITFDYSSLSTNQTNPDKLGVLTEIPYSSGNDVAGQFKTNPLLEDEWGGDPPNRLRSWSSSSSFSSGYSSDHSLDWDGGTPEDLSLSHKTELASYDALGPTGMFTTFVDSRFYVFGLTQ